jgi:prevent-host-death family protein
LFLVENAKKRLDEYVITVNGIPAAVIISAFEYESWKETNGISHCGEQSYIIPLCTIKYLFWY